MSRRTYLERRAYSARVMRFRQAIYRDRPELRMYDTKVGAEVTFRLSNGCRLLLLRLSDDMDQNCNVSISRSALAEHLGVAPARITEWVRVAHLMGLLTTIRRGRPGVTAVYRGVIPGPEEVRHGVPSTRYARADHALVRLGVPKDDAAWYAQGTTQELVGPARIAPAGSCAPERRSNDREDRAS